MRSTTRREFACAERPSAAERVLAATDDGQHVRRGRRLLLALLAIPLYAGCSATYLNYSGQIRRQRLANGQP